MVDTAVRLTDVCFLMPLVSLVLVYLSQTIPYREYYAFDLAFCEACLPPALAY